MSNVTELLAQPEQKPVTNEPTKTAGAAIMPNGVCVSNVYDAYQEGRKSVMVEPLSEGEPLYTSPQKREALSDRLTANMFNANQKATSAACYWAGVSDAEKHHGIGR